MISKEAEEVLNRAVRYAFERQHEYFTLEHVLLSLLEEASILEIIQACGGSYLDLKKELEEYLLKEVPKNKKWTGESADQEDSEEEEETIAHPVATLSIQRLIQRALFHVQSAGKDEIHPEDLFVALFQSKDSFALHLLQKQKIERLDVLEFISHGTRKIPEVKRDQLRPVPTSGGGAGADPSRSRQDPLDTYTVCLNQLARSGKIDPLVGRENEVERIVQTLCRRQKNNPILVGEAGVGKTALVDGLALKVESGEIPDLLKNVEIYALDMGALLAGAKFRGDFEYRLKKVLKGLEDRKAQGKRPILMIDEIHTVIGAGAVSGGTLDAANLLKPVLSRGELQCIGLTTYSEYRNVFEKDHALVRRFQKIEVPEPTIEETIRILEGLKPKYETHHQVSYKNEAIRAAVELSAKHLRERFLPDKAIDVMDEVGARARVRRAEELKKQRLEKIKKLNPDTVQVEIQAEKEEDSEEPSVKLPSKGSSDPIELGATDVEEVIAKIARIPSRSVSVNQRKRLRSLENDLRLTIFGQDEAVDKVVAAIRMSRSGLGQPDRPVGSFLFCGPTGVGKTELSKQLAHCLGISFLRYDMSEYMEKHTVSRLIGAPPGYVGFEQAGLLTDAVLKNPHSVVLLDEIEKAHMDVWNILLQIMDHGTLTDNNGRKVDFRNIILILTSNVGTREHGRRSMGMGNPEASRSSVSKQEIERTFSPEFRNRLDAIIYFSALDPVTVAQVVGKQLLELESQLLAKGVEISVDPEVREWLAHKGYDVLLGARPMGRLIQDKIKRPLSEQILFGKLESGGKVRISLEDQEPTFIFEPRSGGSSDSSSDRENPPSGAKPNGKKPRGEKVR